MGDRGPAVERAVLAYVAAWNEDDEERMRALLETCFAEDGVVVSNVDEIRGRRALGDVIARFRRARPHHRGLLTSGVEHHHHVFRFTAVVIDENGTAYSPALDVGELDADDRICRIITFFAPLPSPPEHWPAELVAAASAGSVGVARPSCGCSTGASSLRPKRTDP